MKGRRGKRDVFLKKANERKLDRGRKISAVKFSYFRRDGPFENGR